MGEKKDHASDEEDSRTISRKHWEKDILRQKLRSKVKVLQQEATRHITSELSNTFSKLLQELEEPSKKISTADSTSRDKSIRYKEFVPRESLLTELFEIQHIRSIYHAFIAALMISLIKSVIQDFLGDGVVRLGLGTIRAGFVGFDKAIIIWLGMFSGLIGTYWGTVLWCAGRKQFHKNSQRYWDYTFFALLLVSYFSMFCIPAFFAAKLQLGLGCAFAVLMEQIRLVMKMHAFVRRCTPRYFTPAFTHYIYFLFAPTLLYRDSYPRTSHIRWKFVISRFLEVVGAFFFVCFLGEHHLIPAFSDFGLRKMDWKSLTMTIFSAMLPSWAIFISGFYLLLHAWLNAWAEMLRFADRTFYLDWWNSTTYVAYYRTWNIVVHDFLYEYVYADVRRLFANLGNEIARAIGTLAVFIISALVHEYIIGFALGFCYPILLVQFLSLGLILAFLRLDKAGGIGNIFLWWSLNTGFGIQVSLYAMEMNARRNCPSVENESIMSYFIPRSWSCNGLN